MSVVLAVFNGEAYLAEAIESVLGQTLEELELIAVDDGSQDGSRAILEEFARRDPRVRVVVNARNLGLAAAANRGWRLARAAYVARLDADDVALPERLSSQVEFLDANPSVAAVGGAAITIDRTGRRLSTIPVPTSSSVIRNRLPRQNCFVHSAVTLRRAALEELGGYRFSPGGAYDLWLRLSERFDLANLPQPVVLYRLFTREVSLAAVEELNRNALAIQAAARSRAGSGVDPLAGVHELTPAVLERIGITQAEIDRELEVRCLWVASELVELGRQAEAELLVSDVGRALGRRMTRVFAAARELRQATELLRAGRRRRAARHVLRAGLRDPRYTSARVVAALGHRRHRTAAAPSTDA